MKFGVSLVTVVLCLVLVPGVSNAQEKIDIGDACPDDTLTFYYGDGEEYTDEIDALEDSLKAAINSIYGVTDGKAKLSKTKYYTDRLWFQYKLSSRSARDPNGNEYDDGKCKVTVRAQAPACMRPDSEGYIGMDMDGNIVHGDEFMSGTEVQVACDYQRGYSHSGGLMDPVIFRCDRVMDGDRVSFEWTSIYNNSLDCQHVLCELPRIRNRHNKISHYLGRDPEQTHYEPMEHDGDDFMLGDFVWIGCDNSQYYGALSEEGYSDVQGMLMKCTGEDEDGWTIVAGYSEYDAFDCAEVECAYSDIPMIDGTAVYYLGHHINGHEEEPQPADMSMTYHFQDAVGIKCDYQRGFLGMNAHRLAKGGHGYAESGDMPSMSVYTCNMTMDDGGDAVAVWTHSFGNEFTCYEAMCYQPEMGDNMLITYYWSGLNHEEVQEPPTERSMYHLFDSVWIECDYENGYFPVSEWEHGGRHGVLLTCFADNHANSETHWRANVTEERYSSVRAFRCERRGNEPEEPSDENDSNEGGNQGGEMREAARECMESVKDCMGDVSADLCRGYEDRKHSCWTEDHPCRQNEMMSHLINAHLSWLWDQCTQMYCMDQISQCIPRDSVIWMSFHVEDGVSAETFSPLCMSETDLDPLLSCLGEAQSMCSEYTSEMNAEMVSSFSTLLTTICDPNSDPCIFHALNCMGGPFFDPTNHNLMHICWEREEALTCLDNLQCDRRSTRRFVQSLSAMYSETCSSCSSAFASCTIHNEHMELNPLDMDGMCMNHEHVYGCAEAIYDHCSEEEQGEILSHIGLFHQVCGDQGHDSGSHSSEDHSFGPLGACVMQIKECLAPMEHMHSGEYMHSGEHMHSGEYMHSGEPMHSRERMSGFGEWPLDWMSGFGWPWDRPIAESGYEGEMSGDQPMQPVGSGHMDQRPEGSHEGGSGSMSDICSDVRGMKQCVKRAVMSCGIELLMNNPWVAGSDSRERDSREDGSREGGRSMEDARSDGSGRNEEPMPEGEPSMESSGDSMRESEPVPEPEMLMSGSYEDGRSSQRDHRGSMEGDYYRSREMEMCPYEYVMGAIEYGGKLLFMDMMCTLGDNAGGCMEAVHECAVGLMDYVNLDNLMNMDRADIGNMCMLYSGAMECMRGIQHRCDVDIMQYLEIEEITYLCGEHTDSGESQCNFMEAIGTCVATGILEGIDESLMTRLPEGFASAAEFHEWMMNSDDLICNNPMIYSVLRCLQRNMEDMCIRGRALATLCDDEPACPGQFVWNECGSACNRTCDNPEPICNRMCVARCECPSRSPILQNPMEAMPRCTSQERCTAAECDFMSAVSMCVGLSMEDGMSGLLMGVIPEDFPSAEDFNDWMMYNEDLICSNPMVFSVLQCMQQNTGNRCISGSELARLCENEEPTCPGQFVWNECGSACNRTCDNPDPMCIEMCVARCECPSRTPILQNPMEAVPRCTSQERCTAPTDCDFMTSFSLCADPDLLEGMSSPLMDRLSQGFASAEEFHEWMMSIGASICNDDMVYSVLQCMERSMESTCIRGRALSRLCDQSSGTTTLECMPYEREHTCPSCWTSCEDGEAMTMCAQILECTPQCVCRESTPVRMADGTCGTEEQCQAPTDCDFMNSFSLCADPDLPEGMSGSLMDRLSQGFAGAEEFHEWLMSTEISICNDDEVYSVLQCMERSMESTCIRGRALSRLCDQSSGTTDHPGEVACTADAMTCPDGTMLGRVPPLCEFPECPEPSSSPCMTPDVSNDKKVFVIEEFNMQNIMSILESADQRATQDYYNDDDVVYIRCKFENRNYYLPDPSDFPPESDFDIPQEYMGQVLRCVNGEWERLFGYEEDFMCYANEK